MKTCCEEMKRRLDHRCEQHPNPYDCPDNLIALNQFGFGIIVHDGGESSVIISHCPWCGAELPIKEVETGTRVLDVRNIEITI